VTTRLAALAATLILGLLPASALADDATAPDAQPSCLAAKGSVGDLSIRGVTVGAKARLRDADGQPIAAHTVSYCVDGGGQFSFSLSGDSDVVLILSTADGDSIGPINPTSPAQSARAEFPKMRRIARTTTGTSIYRVDGRRQLLLGVTGDRVSFVGVADRLLLEYPQKLRYHLSRFF
jgi:hypothetical protein